MLLLFVLHWRGTELKIRDKQQPYYAHLSLLLTFSALLQPPNVSVTMLNVTKLWYMFDGDPH